MAGPENEELDLESPENYLKRTEARPVGLEPVESYVQRTNVDIKLKKTKAGNIIAYILVASVALYPLLYVWALANLEKDLSEDVNTFFVKWFDVVAPLLGIAIGALFGLSLATRRGEESD